MAQIFISYARKDGADKSLRLYNDLQASGIGVWRDNRIDPTADFTGEIEAAIDDATHVAVIVTPDLKRADSFVRLEVNGNRLYTHLRPQGRSVPISSPRCAFSSVGIFA